MHICIKEMCKKIIGKSGTEWAVSRLFVGHIGKERSAALLFVQETWERSERGGFSREANLRRQIEKEETKRVFDFTQKLQFCWGILQRNRKYFVGTWIILQQEAFRALTSCWRISPARARSTLLREMPFAIIDNQIQTLWLEGECMEGRIHAHSITFYEMLILKSV